MGIPIKCPHCKLAPTSPVDYKDHLHSKVHHDALNKLNLKLNLKLREMRDKQRNLQREADKGLETDKKQFCQTCSLIYKQSKTEHNKTENHKMIRRFLMPRCDICKIDFKSPMSYEKHQAEYSHILKSRESREASANKTKTETKNEEVDSQAEGLDMENLVTLDEVGDVEIPKDGAEEDGEAKEEKRQRRDKEEEERKRRKEKEEQERKKRKAKEEKRQRRDKE